MSLTGAIAGTHPGLPAIQVLNLAIDGSTPATVSLTAANFTYVVRVIWKFQFTDAQMEWTNFGAGAVLANGIQLIYNGADLLPEPIKDNGNFHDYGYDVIRNADDAATQGNLLSARWTFSKWVPHGLSMFNGENFGIKISDDLRPVTRTDIVDFIAVVEGWKMHP